MKQKVIAIRNTCRVCGFKPLVPILSLGDLYMSDFVDDASQQDESSRIPLELVLCNKKNGGCGLLQLKHTAAHEAMYRNYWYRSGVNKTMTDELNGIAKTIEELVDLKSGDCLIDIGANDGTLLRGYSINGIKTIGFEPAINLMKWAREGTTRIINDFFGYNAWQKEFGNSKAIAITAIAMFYDLEDPNIFVSDVARCLDKEGVFIIQMSYLPSMLSQNAFDNICHEHLEYYSLLSLENLLRRHNLEIFDVELNNINGGSFRTYIRHKDGGKTVKISAGAEKRMKDLRKFEKGLGLDDKKIYENFVKNIYTLRDQLITFLKIEYEKGKKIYVYGASTKGNTLLQFYGLDYHIITAAAERNPDKWGKKTIGTLIPIISEGQARAEKPDYFLVLPWHFMEEFKEREQEFSRSGGKFIIPLPKFEII